jgi:hypothetical protein
MRHLNRQIAASEVYGLIAALVLAFSAGAGWADSILLAWDVEDEDLWAVETTAPPFSTFIRE